MRAAEAVLHHGSALKRRHVRVVVLRLREHAEALMTHSVGVGRVAEKLLALRGAVALLLGDREELGNLSLGDAEGVVADVEALLVDAVAELALVSCALHKSRADGR